MEKGATVVAALGSMAAGKHSEVREARRHSAMAIGRQCEKEREEPRERMGEREEGWRSDSVFPFSTRRSA
jgi:hypothetical protein